MSAFYELLHASGGGSYLEVAAAVTTFLPAGRFYEARARRMAGEAMRELAAVLVPVADLRAGRRFVVRLGEWLAADGLALLRAFAVGDAIKPTAAPAVAELRELELSTVLLSGRSDGIRGGHAVVDAMTEQVT